MKKSLFDKTLVDGHFRVSIFGSARIKKGDSTYRMVQDLARKIGESNIDIVTGGGPGLMEAASSGHKKGNTKKQKAHTVGLLIKLPHEQRSNKHLDVKKEFSHFSGRLDTFMVLSNAVVVAPGGIGTLLELIYAWQLIQVKQICDIPIILIGKQWKPFIKWIKSWPVKHGFMAKSDVDSLFLVNTTDQAMDIITEAHELYKKGGKNICLNIKKYKI